MIAPEHSFTLYPELRQLADLKDAGWIFAAGCDASGFLVNVTGLRPWPEGQADALHVSSQTDAGALRMDHAGGLLWQRDGTLADVVNGLLALPAPSDPFAPRLVRGARPPLIEQVSRGDNEFAVNELIELRASIVVARRLVRRRSPVGMLLAEAYTWLGAWLDEWQSGEVQTQHLLVLYRQMVERLTRIAERMSIVAESEWDICVHARRDPWYWIRADWQRMARVAVVLASPVAGVALTLLMVAWLG